MTTKRRCLAALMSIVLLINTLTGTVWADTTDLTGTEYEVQDTGTDSGNIEETLTVQPDHTGTDETEEANSDSADVVFEEDSVTDGTDDQQVEIAEDVDAAGYNLEENSDVENEDTETDLFSDGDDETPANTADLDFLKESSFLTMCQQIFGDGKVPSEASIVYVAGNEVTENTENKGSYVNPWGSLSAARNANTGKACVYYLLGNYTSSSESEPRQPYTGQDVTGAWPAYSEPAIIVSQNENAYLSIGDTWSITGNVGFYRTSIHMDRAANVKIYCNGNTVVFGGQGMNNLSVTGKTDGTDTYYPVLFGGGASDVSSTDLIVNGGTWARIYGAGDGASVSGTSRLVIDGAVYGTDSVPASGQCSAHIVTNPALKNLYINTEDICGGAAATALTRPGVGSAEVSVSYLNYGNTYNKSGLYSISPNGGKQGTAVLSVENSAVSQVGRGIGSSSNLTYTLKNVTANVNMTYPGSPATINGVGDGLQSGSDFTITAEACNLQDVYAPGSSSSWEECGRSLGTLTYNIINTVIAGQLNGYLSGNAKFNWKESVLNLSGEKTDVKGNIHALKTINLDGLNKTVALGSDDTSKMRINAYDGYGQHFTNGVFFTDVAVTLSNGSTVELYKNLKDINLLEATSANVYEDITIDNISGSGQLNVADNKTATVKTVQTGSSLKAGPAGSIENSAMIVGQFSSVDGSEFAMGAGCYTDQSPYYIVQPGTGSSAWLISKAKVSALDATHIYVNQASGKDDNAGGKFSPVKTLARAFEKITSEKKTVVLQSLYEMETDESLPSLPENAENVMVTLTANDGETNYKNNAILVMPSSEKAGCDLTIQNIYLNGKTNLVYLYSMDHEVIFDQGASGKAQNGYKAAGMGAGAPNSGTVSRVKLTVNEFECGDNSSFMFQGTVGSKDAADSEFYYNSELLAEINIKKVTGNQMNLRISPTVYGSCSIVSEAVSNQNMKINAKIYGDMTYNTSRYNYYEAAVDCYCTGKMTFAGAQAYGNANNPRISGTYLGGIEYNAVASKNNPLQFSSIKLGGNLVVNGAINTSKLTFDKIENYSESLTGNIIVNHCGTCQVITCSEDTSDKLTVNVLNTNADTSVNSTYSMTQVTGVGTWKQEPNTEVNVTEKFEVRNCVLEKGSVLGISEGAGNTFGTSDSGNQYTLRMKDGAALKLTRPLRLFGNLDSVVSEEGETAPYIEVNCDTVDSADEENCSRITGSVKGKIRLKTNSEYEGTLKNSQKIWLDQASAETNTEKTSVSVQTGSDAGILSAYDDTMNVSSDAAASGRCVICFGGPDRSIIYINSSTGDDSNLGIDPDKPVKTMETAYEKVLPGGTIVVQNPVSVSAWPTLMRKIHISSYDRRNKRFYREGALTLPKTLSLAEDLYLECLSVSNTNTTITANGKKIVLGVNVNQLPVVKDENGQNTVHNFQGTISTIVGMNTQKQTGSDIEVHSGNIGKICVAGNSNVHAGNNPEASYNYTMTGGTVGEVYADYNADPVTGEMNYKLSGGKVGMCMLGKNSADYNAEFKINAWISGDFDFDTLYCASKHYHSNLPLTVSFDNWNKEDTCKGQIYIGRINTTANCTDSIDIIDSVIPVINVAENNKDNQTLKVDLNLKDGAHVKQIITGNTKNQFESIDTLNINLLGNDARIDSLKNYGAGTSKNGQIKHVNINIGNGVENTLDFLKDVSDLEFRPVLHVTGGSLAVFPASLKVNGMIAQVSACEVDAGSGIYVPKSTTLKADYIGADEASKGETQGYAYLYTNNGAVLTITGTVTGFTQLRAAEFAGTVSENTDGFVNGVSVFAKLSGSSENAIDIYSEYEKGDIKNVLTTTANETTSQRKWEIQDSTDTQSRNVVYVNGIDGSDKAEGSFVQPVATLSKAYEKAAERYKEMYDLAAASSTDPELVTELKKSLSEGITIYVDGRITLGDISAVDMLAAVKEAEALTGLEDVGPIRSIQIVGMTREACIRFSDSSEELVLPIATVLRSVTLESICVSNSPTIFANGRELIVGQDVICSSLNNGFIVYGGGKASVETSSLKINGGSWAAIYGGSSSKSVGSVELSLGGEAKADKVYGGGYAEAAGTKKITLTIDGGTYEQVCGGGFDAPSGIVEVNMLSGTVKNLYGSGEQTTAESESGSVRIGGGSETAFVTSIYRGAGVRTGFKAGNTAVTVLNDGCVFGNENAPGDFCGGGYSGTVSSTDITINGGIVYGDIHAGGYGVKGSTEYGNVSSDTAVTINGGTINGNIFGGGNNGRVLGTSRVTYNGGTVQKEKAIYGGGDAADVKKSIVTIGKDGFDGVVYGGSFQIVNEAKNQQEESEIILNGSAKSVFGGSNLSGDIKNMTSVQVPSDAAVTASLYGGGNQAAISGKTSTQVEGTLNGDIFGGGKGELKTTNTFARTFLRIFTESDLIDANVPVTDITISGTVNGNVFGGGEYATVGTTDETASEDAIDTAVSKVTIKGTVNGKVYGGGKGEQGHDYAAVNGSTRVMLGTGGIVKTTADSEANTMGAVFGGGQNAPVAGNTEVQMTDGTYSMVYGGNDLSGTIQGTAQINVSGGNVTEAYAGGYGADTANASAEVIGGTVETLFGGGNAATVTASTEITVDTNKDNGDQAQHVKTVFAGNNKAVMTIQPELSLAGKIGEVYGGGNEGIMDCESLHYTFDYPGADIETVYAGCRNTAEVTSDAELILVSGSYGTVYGGNNVSGYMSKTDVIVDASAETGKPLSTDTVYGGGNHAEALETNVTVKNGTVTTVYGGGNLAETKNANVNLQKGTVTTIYGGGNAASVTEFVNIASTGSTSDQISVTDLYCGNNAADMSIAPTVDLQAGTITNFYGGGNKGAMTCSDGVQYTLDSDALFINTIYGGGNKGAMTCSDGVQYTLDSDALFINTIYGGGNEAGVTETAKLTLGKGTYRTVYGGSNSKGYVEKSVVNIQGNVGDESSSGLTGKVFGGGRGNATDVNASEINLQDGKISGNVYGGSGFGKVTSASVIAKEKENGKVQVLGNIYGAGYGDSSFVGKTEVDISLDLVISDSADTSADVTVEEKAKDAESISGESYASASWNSKSYTDGSYIAGNVFGGGDMGQVGSGHINASTNTADISEEGSTEVKIQSGYIRGNVFGGGNGQPGGQDENGNSISVYNLYMGTVFGTSNVTMTGGYVNGSIFGCGQQSRTYSSGSASHVAITADNTKVLLIGGSIFGGGNKGNGSTQNASVATVYGDTHVKITGVKEQNTRIYMLSTETSGGGVYGDGNLCLVSGKKYVSLTDFSCGIGSNVKLLKTFYSLQRADVVDLIGSRIVLLGAVDLVDDNADDTQYSINRVGQLNLKENSTIKVTKTVNLLAELTSDEQQERQFINQGNNNGNAEITGNDYTADGGTAPNDPLTTDEVQKYREAYAQYMENGSESTDFSSINVVCVANGGYLEVKKSTAEYGPVTGLFTLQLVNANPGEGGGFVYADIKGKKIAEDKYVTGNFVCVTKAKDSGNDYMHAYHNVGGRVTDGRYEYYVWYLKGNKYNYDVDLTAYIGTSDTDFTKEISLPAETEGYKYVLMSLKQDKKVSSFADDTFQNTWDASTDPSSDKIAVEVKLVKIQRANNSLEEVTTEIGFLGYETENNSPDGTAKTTANGERIWGIWRKEDGNWKFQKCKDAEKSFAVTEGDALGEIDTNTVGIRMQFTLHKGSGMTDEFRNLPFAMEIAAVSDKEYDKGLSDTTPQIQIDSCVLLTENITLSAIRLVPSQAAYLGSGRLFGGISSSATANITDTSSITMQFITKYIPSAFNNGSQNQIEETLVTGYSDTYLLDANGVGYTIQEDADGIKILNKVNVGDNTITNYTISKDSSGQYQVTYTRTGDTAGEKEEKVSCKAFTQSSGFTLPAGTVVTLLASMDEGTPTYWYYYCTVDTTEIPLKDFIKMNTSNGTSGHETVYSTISSNSSSRVTENMIFVFDFSNVSDSKWKNEATVGTAILRHTYQANGQSADIMDYISVDKTTDSDQVSYTHEAPKQTDLFEVSKKSDGIKNFAIKNADKKENYQQKEQMNLQIEIDPDNSVTNTQFEERQYAVRLHLMKADEKEWFSEISFPEGTTFVYNGKRLALEDSNQSVTIPVGTVGSHKVRLSTDLEGLETGKYKLVAGLYSTSATGYYNSITINDEDTDKQEVVFEVTKAAEYALKVSETGTGKNRLVKAGDSLAFKVTAVSTDSTDTEKVQVKLYQYEKGAYKVVSLNSVLNGQNEITAVKEPGTPNWMPEVVVNAPKGTYRLEFTYHNRTEYWDFIVIS